MPEISIILPSYNVEKYISKALESCINQSFKDIEILVVDDCGTDASISIAKEYAKKDERIRIIHNKENLKLLRARYEGVKAARGRYVMFLDPDDYLELNTCEECMKYLNDDIDLLCFNYRTTKEHKNSEQTFTMGEYDIEEFLIFLLYTSPRGCWRAWNLWNKIFKKEMYLTSFKLMNIPDDVKINMAEDVLFFIAYLNQAHKVQTLSNVFYNYNSENTDSITNNKSIEKIFYSIQDLEFCQKKIDAMATMNNQPFYSLYCKIVSCCLRINCIDLLYKNVEKVFFNKLKLKLKKKMIKLQRKNYMKNAICYLRKMNR